MSAALEGRQYNRAERFHKAVAEAFERMRWPEFIETGECGISDGAASTLKARLLELQGCISRENLSDLLDSRTGFQDIYSKYVLFCEDKAKVLPNFRFSSSYIDNLT